MDISLFFEPIQFSREQQPEKSFGSIVDVHTKDHLPDPRSAQIAIVGVKDDPGRGQTSLNDAPDAVRKELYALFIKNSDIRVADLGNMTSGHSQKDTLFALSTVLAELIQNGTIPIVLGGGKALAYANYLAYEKLERTVNLTSVEGTMEVGSEEDELTPTSYLTKIVMHQPNYLFNFANIGYQSYQTDSAMVDLMGKLYFDTLRLGEVRNHTQLAEPILRDTDLLIMNMSAVKAGDAPGNVAPSPNGLSAEDICQLSMYAGLSDKVSTYAVYEFDPARDVDGRTAKLIAQMVWCFIDGYCGRAEDIPYLSKTQFVQYHVPIASGKQDITFLKSKKSDRWWMQIPYSKNERGGLQRIHFAPCSYLDYNTALQDEIPDTWWRTYQKLT